MLEEHWQLDVWEPRGEVACDSAQFTAQPNCGSGPRDKRIGVVCRNHRRITTDRAARQRRKSSVRHQPRQHIDSSRLEHRIRPATGACGARQYEAVEVRLISDGVGQGDCPAHRVSYEDQWTCWLRGADRASKPLEIGDELIETIDVTAFAVRASVATMIERIHRVAKR